MTHKQAQPLTWLLLVPAGAQLLLHLLTNGHFGIFRDEYYYLACADRPAWGYVDQPPLSIWILAAWKSVFGDSVQALRMLPALCGSALVVLTGAAAAQMGGGRWAQFTAGLGVSIGAVALVTTGFYSMNAFDLLFWLGAYTLLLRIARAGHGGDWVALGVVLGLGLFNKVGLLVFGAALAVGLAATRHRRWFADKRLYVAGAVALVFLAPYILWNATHGWPTLEFIRNAQSGKIAAFTPLEYFMENLLEANPLTVPVWLAGFLWLVFARRAKAYRLVALMVLVTFIILNVQRSKPYYFASSFPVLMAAGGVAWEQWTRTRRWVWARWLLVMILVVGGVVIAPMAVPVLSPERTLAWGQRLGMVPAEQEVGVKSPLPQYFSDRFGWEELAQHVSEAYQALPQEDREHCVAWGQNYGHAGALEYWADTYPLPPAYATHNNYWFWGPPPEDTSVVIVVDETQERLMQLFEVVEASGVSTDPWARESALSIWTCRGPRVSLSAFWARDKHFD